ncbi:hypothetical protein V6N11_063279 [Hibiscus sabdariffa]|uniref:Subtilisin-like protease n=1 Tax=Hibiscus sabdariffa TaxID=183260 RepID=A0ABR2NGX6_9ROSI
MKIKFVEIFVVLSLCYACVVAEEKVRQAKRTYIVLMDKSSMPEAFTHHSLWYHSSLKSVSESAPVLYTYENVVHGYSTRMTPEEAESLGKQYGVLYVLPEVIYQLHTTRTPEFLGLGNISALPLFPTLASMSDVIVGLVDTGAGTLDRDFPAPITLGSGDKYTGTTLYNGKPLSNSTVPLVFGANVSNSNGGAICLTGSLIREKVSGKIVVCDRGGGSRALKGLEVMDAGGVGMILANINPWGEERIADAQFLPSAAVGEKAGDSIKSYISSAQNPTATIGTATTELGVPAPVVAAFSSRVAALDPGLVYNATVDDYLGFLCALNYTPDEIKGVTRMEFTCETGKNYTLGDFNYPSFSVPLKTALGTEGDTGVSSTVTYTRTLTNVGAPATYKVSLYSQTQAVEMSVEPATLNFSEQYEEKSYRVTFRASSKPTGSTSFARLEWSDGKHIVGSPIAYSWK